ncbi:hypothetical protein HPB50_017187 [Hyalomma asiaticum]|uniref:Uncharacterized protein n=1 Tax=Hyalomma asiaticum TaxID=266040 RepID=A0ACB7TJB6_HYAAI|nr:hypothetical protein HPB50_017187 [Hyalomma asiaticum]
MNYATKDFPISTAGKRCQISVMLDEDMGIRKPHKENANEVPGTRAHPRHLLGGVINVWVPRGDVAAAERPQWRSPASADIRSRPSGSGGAEGEEGGRCSRVVFPSPWLRSLLAIDRTLSPPSRPSRAAPPHSAEMGGLPGRRRIAAEICRMKVEEDTHRLCGGRDSREARSASGRWLARSGRTAGCVRWNHAGGGPCQEHPPALGGRRAAGGKSAGQHPPACFPEKARAVESRWGKARPQPDAPLCAEASS